MQTTGIIFISTIDLAILDLSPATRPPVAVQCAQRTFITEEYAELTQNCQLFFDLHVQLRCDTFDRLHHYCFCLSQRADLTPGRDKEATFLSGIKSLWRGFIHMHSVAKLVTKAFPVSGIMDQLTEVKQKRKKKQ